MGREGGSEPGEGAGLGPFLMLLEGNRDLASSVPRASVSGGCVRDWFPL